MSWYYDYEPTRPIETDKGIKAKSKRGKFVKNWWANRWLTAMEAVMDKGRLQRGRRYARKGQVLSLEEKGGEVVAKVQGSRRTPYKISIRLTPLSESAWEKVIKALGNRPDLVAQLLAGEMPQDIEEAFVTARIDLFPSRKELKQDCNCPDSATVCKHLAAVHYILAERFDEDPFLLFRLRGRSQDELLASLGTGEMVEDVNLAPTYAPAPPLAESLENFWAAGEALDTLSIHIAPPEAPYPVLDRLGEPDFLPEASRWLMKAYEGVTETAVQTAFDSDG